MGESVAGHLRPYFPQLAQIIANGMQDPVLQVAINAIRALGSLLDEFEDHDVPMFQHLVPGLFAVLDRCLQEDTELAVVPLELFEQALETDVSN